MSKPFIAQNGKITNLAVDNLKLDNIYVEQDGFKINQKLSDNKAKTVLDYSPSTDTFIFDTNININNNKDLYVNDTSMNNFINNLVTFQNNITIDQVILSINAFKTSIYNVNYLTNLINKYSNEIIKANDYNSVLKPIIEKEFYNNSDYFWLYQVSNKHNDLDTKLYLNWKNGNSWTNKYVKQLVNDPSYNLLINQNNLCTDILNNYISNNSNTTNFYYNDISIWADGLGLYFNYFTKDLLDNNKWIRITSFIYLFPYLPNTNNINDFSPQYLNLINYISSNINNWTSTIDNNVWQFDDPVNFAVLKCISSEQNPEWNGQLITSCNIPGSDEDISNIIYSIIVDLFYNYPKLFIGQYAISTYQINNINYISIILVDIDPSNSSKLVIRQKQINLNIIFNNQFDIHNDLNINGSLNLTTYDNQSIIKTDSVNKITCFNNKIGINEQPYQVSGLLDINNISNNSFLTLLSTFTPMQNYTYNYVNILFNTSYNILNNKVDLSKIINNDLIIVFKSPIQNIILKSDITFLYTSVNGPFSSNKFNDDSFSKISQIVNEINKMIPEIKYVDINGSTIFSFVELLNDTNYYYMNSIRAFINYNTNEIYFVMSPLNVNSIMINPSFTSLFTRLINALSGLNRMINYSILVIKRPEILQQILKGDSLNSFTAYISNSEYFSNRFGMNNTYISFSTAFPNNDDNGYTFHELFPQWNLQNYNNLYILNTDTLVGNIFNGIISQFENLYGNNSINQNFIINYIWVKLEKVTVVNYIDINNTKYCIISGINLSDYISKSILSNGDVISAGQFSVEDNNNKSIFKVDTVKKTISNMYRVSIGKLEPLASLDVNDSGINDVLNLIDTMAYQYNNLNNNISKITASNIETVVPTFIDQTTNLPIIQTIGNYYFIIISNTNYPAESLTKYSWLYPNWVNSKLNEVVDPSNQTSLNNIIISTTSRILSNLLFDNSDNINIFEFLFGTKIFITRNILLDDNVLYTIGTGVNLQNFNLRYNTNKNVSLFVDAINTFNTYFQYIIATINNIDITTLPNYTSVNNNLNLMSNIYPFSSATFKKIVVNSTNLYQTTITTMFYEFDTHTLITGTDTIKLINEPDSNIRFKYINFVIRLNEFYNNLKKSDNGIVQFEDENVDYFGLFYAIDSTTFLCLDYQINNIIYPAVDVRGDLRIKGDFVIKDINNETSNDNYLSIDPTLKFVGINTDQRYINYPYTFDVNSTTNVYSSQHHVYISKDTNPLLCCERIAENPTDIVNPNISSPLNNYKFFRSFSAETIRRKSNLYTVQEMYDYAQANASINKNGAKYGVEISVEITDKNDYTSFIGNFGMVIDSLDSNGVIRPGFIARAYDVDPKTLIYKTPRPILYVDYASTLHVDNIVVGKTSPLSIATGPSNITVDSITLGSSYNMYVKKDASGNETLWWGNVQLGSQPVSPELIQQALNNQK